MIAFYTNVGVMAFLSAILAVSLNLLIGESGIFSAAQGVFYGVGAYSTAFLALHVTGSILLALPLSAVVAGLTGLLFAIPAVRIRGDYFVVASIGVSVILVTVFSQWNTVTGGDSGLSGYRVGSLVDGKVQFTSANSNLILAVVLFVLSVAAVAYLTSWAPIGRMIRAVRDDQTAAESVGKSPVSVRVIAVVVTAMLAGVAGTVYAVFVQYVDPTAFGTNESILIVTMVVLGGSGSIVGPVIGALVLGFGEPSLGLLPLPTALIGPLEQAAVGVVLVVVMIWQPEGLVSIRLARRPHRTGTVAYSGAALSPTDEASDL